MPRYEPDMGTDCTAKAATGQGSTRTDMARTFLREEAIRLRKLANVVDSLCDRLPEGLQGVEDELLTEAFVRLLQSTESEMGRLGRKLGANYNRY